MAKMLDLKCFSDDRGVLTVIEKELPFAVKRVFYIYGVPENVRRGGHRHHRTRQALVCIGGRCVVDCSSPAGPSPKSSYLLDNPQKCLIVEPEDFHYMHSFSPGAVLLVLASEFYDKGDYIFQDYGQ